MILPKNIFDQKSFFSGTIKELSLFSPPATFWPIANKGGGWKKEEPSAAAAAAAAALDG